MEDRLYLMSITAKHGECDRVSQILVGESAMNLFTRAVTENPYSWYTIDGYSSPRGNLGEIDRESLVERRLTISTVHVVQVDSTLVSRSK